jgi:hypothetical protein
MGYFFRKRVGLGPFRLNFSKSGVGASVGVTGARVTVTPRGATYVTVGRRGFYYRETLFESGRKQPGTPSVSAVGCSATGGSSPGQIVTAGVSDLVDSSSERLLQQLNERASMGNPAIILYCLAGLLGLCGFVFVGDNQLTYTTGLPILAALGVMVFGLVVHKRNTESRTSRLFYELDGAEQQKHSIVQQALGQLSQCQRIWRVEGESATFDRKRNAGASSLVRRTTITVGNLNPPRVETNVPVPCVNMGRSQLFFLPDVILYREGGRYGAVAYGDFRIEQGFTQFIESDAVPLDAAVVSHTWRYVNRNGGPDRRFNNNRQLPVLRLGVLVFTSAKGLNIQLNTSNGQRSLDFVNCWRTRFSDAPGSRAQGSHDEPSPQERATTSSGPKAAARKILGVAEDASEAEISAAYRRLAQMYHPDKVVGLAPEFQALADKRMKEINAAYEVLKSRS